MTPADPGLRLAADLGGTSTRVALVRGAVVVERRELPTRADAGPDAVIAALLRTIGTWVERSDTLHVAATGRVHQGRVSAVNSGTMPGWSDIDLAERLSATLQRRVVVVNDAHAAAWGEYRYGRGVGVEDFAFVTVSSGVGAGIVANGRPLVGARGLAAHLGFLPHERAVFLEAIASGRAIAERASTRLGRAVSTRAVFAAADAGDSVAERVVDQAVEALADALVTLRWVIDPARVAIGGSVGLAPGYVERLRAALRRRADADGLEVVPAGLAGDAGLIGAAAWAL